MPLLRFVLLGPQGSGKGTQAERLKARFAIPHISTGDLFRANIKEGTELGKQVKAILAEGRLVPDEVTNAMVRERLKDADCQEGFLLDGYPRNIAQAEVLDAVAGVDTVINIELSDEEAVERLAGRRVCPKCGTIYHIKTKPAPNGVCPCGGSPVQREDDREEVIRERLAIYHRETEPILAYYRESGRVIDIDGRPPIEEVAAAIAEKLDHA